MVAGTARTCKCIQHTTEVAKAWVGSTSHNTTMQARQRTAALGRYHSMKYSRKSTCDVNALLLSPWEALPAVLLLYVLRAAIAVTLVMVLLVSTE